MARIFSYKIADDFFKDLANKHVDINDYCGTSIQELQEKLSSVDGIVSPILVFYDYSGKLTGNDQRTFNTRSISFSIYYTGIKADDFPQQIIAVDDAETIGLEVLSRINIGSKMESIGWLYNNFIKESVNYEEIKGEGIEGVYGMDFHFDLKILEPLTVTKAKWTDGNIFCSP